MSHPTTKLRGLDTNRLDPTQRAALRDQWGVAEHEHLVVVLADSTAEMDATRAIIAAGLAAETGRPWRVLMHPDARGADRALHIARSGGEANRIIFEPRVTEPWSILSACDAALFCGGRCEITLTWAMLAGVPIVAEINSDTQRYLQHQHNALLGPPGLMRKLSWALCRLVDEPDLAKHLTDNARQSIR